jgi:XTP/dITP diphosphohydrolase
VLTVLLTSPRVAPGLLSWQAWSALRSASRVFAGPGHPQLPALTSAGVSVEVVDGPVDGSSLAAMLSAAAVSAAVSGAADGPVVWLAPAGEQAGTGLLSALSVSYVVLHGSHDLPGAHLIDVVGVMDTLRTSCPWDKEQTHSSLLRYLLEEAYETVETVESGDIAALREELGDVLLQVAFHARIAAERSPGEGGFTIDEVADVLVAKLKRRHPHVFGSVAVSSADDVSANWEEIKEAERSERSVATGGAAPSVLDGVPFGQPALSLAAQLQRRAEQAGFDKAAGGPVSAASVSSVSSVVSVADELSDELMRLVARARAAGIDPEMQLREASRRYAERVRRWEQSRTAESP